MRRRLTRTAVVLAVLLACSSFVLAQSTGGLEVVLKNHHDDYVRALAMGDKAAAQRHWNLVRETARELVARGFPRYAEYDRPMPGSPAQQNDPNQLRPDAEPPPTPTPWPQQIAPATITISEQFWAEHECFVPVSIPIEVSQTGMAEELREVTVTVTGHVVDELGYPIEGATVGVSALTADTGHAGDFKRSFSAEGFEDVELAFDDVQLTGPCLLIEPRIVGMGSNIRQVSGAFTLTNNCVTPLEVVIPKEKDVSFTLFDCTGGSSQLGSVDGVDAEDNRMKMLIGPDGRCSLRAGYFGDVKGTINRKISFETSQGLPVSCRREMHLIGAVGTPLIVIPPKIEFDEIVAVGSQASAAIRLWNQSRDEEVVITGLGVAGFALGDFRFVPVSDEGVRVENGTLVVSPGGEIIGQVDFAPLASGFRGGFLSFELGGSSPVPEIIVPLNGLATATP